MAKVASAHQAATASREGNGQEKAGRARRTNADPKRAQQGATTAAAAAPAALNSLSRLQQLADASPQVAQLRRLQALANGRSAPVAQLAGDPEEEEELIQGKFASTEVHPQPQRAPRANNTGLPDQLKNGIESLSGLSMDHVRVHYNSAQPAKLNALAYAQGSDIHLAPGQERHLPHEAWHVVQQAQGRVRPTMQMKDGVQVNDDVGLEREADAMGTNALEGGRLADETHRSFSMPIETALRIGGDAMNSPDENVANNDSGPLANGRVLAQRGGNEVQRIADQRPEAVLQRQVQGWGDGSERVGQLRAWQGVADGRGVGGKSQELTPGFDARTHANEAQHDQGRPGGGASLAAKDFGTRSDQLLSHQPDGLAQRQEKAGIVQRTSIVVGYKENDPMFSAALGNQTSPNDIHTFTETGDQDITQEALELKDEYKDKPVDKNTLYLIGHGLPGKMGELNMASFMNSLKQDKIFHNQITDVKLGACFAMMKQDIDDAPVAYKLSVWISENLDQEVQQIVKLVAGYTANTMGEFAKGQPSYEPLDKKATFGAHHFHLYLYYTALKKMCDEDGFTKEVREGSRKEDWASIKEDALHFAETEATSIVEELIKISPIKPWGQGRVQGEDIKISPARIEYEHDLKIGYTTASITTKNYTSFPERFSQLENINTVTEKVRQILDDAALKVYEELKKKYSALNSSDVSVGGQGGGLNLSGSGSGGFKLGSGGGFPFGDGWSNFGSSTDGTQEK